MLVLLVGSSTSNKEEPPRTAHQQPPPTSRQRTRTPHQPGSAPPAHHSSRLLLAGGGRRGGEEDAERRGHSHSLVTARLVGRPPRAARPLVSSWSLVRRRLPPWRAPVVLYHCSGTSSTVARYARGPSTTPPLLLLLRLATCM